MTSGDRIKQAREVRGLTQAQLAEAVGLHQSNIARLEQGFYQPLEPILESIAIVTGFPVAFFRTDPPIDFPPGSLMYRKRISLRSPEKSRLRQTGRLLFEVGMRLSDEVGSISVDLPSSSGDPTTDAEATRKAFGLKADSPIPNLIRATEQAGVFVIALNEDIDEHDAFSLWARRVEPKPVLVVSSGKPGDRLRFSTAHELGHLILHRNIGTVTKVEERQADTYAAELLLPSLAMRVEMVPPLNLSKLAELKARWGVSIQALVVRALQLQIVTTRQYKYLFQQLSAKGWRSHEPVDLPAERPRLLRQMIESAYGIPVPTARVAGDLNIPERIVQQIIANFAGKTPLSQADPRPKLIRFAPSRTSYN